MRRSICLIALIVPLSFGAARGHAHPHEFIDTGITFRFDAQARLDSIDVVWVWDELTSMLIVADMGMDADGDGRLTDEELDRLRDHFSDWPEGFDGDLHVRQDGGAVALGGPVDTRAEYRDGRLVVSHVRVLPDRISPETGPVILQAYDPGYYAFYDLAGAPEIRGREDCRVEIRKADIAAAQKLYDQLLGQLTEEEIMEEGRYPEVGGAFADEVRLECDRRR